MINNCFVIMGFGKKMCPNSNRIIDLDITYNKLIKPTLIRLNINCIRTDEVINNKNIDAELFQLLYMSDLVIADISTLNPNALYELGIRHALKPFSTIIISEKQATLPFDINHLRVHKYKHDGNDIPITEIDNFSNKLTYIIEYLNNQEHPDIDSPLYTYLDINPPTEINECLFNELSSKYNHTDSIYKLISTANSLKESNNFSRAEEYFSKVFDLTKDEYILKELAICIYKQDENDIIQLKKAENLLLRFIDKYLTQNTELLATLGAIYKRKWYITNNISDLEKCISNYKKSYEISNQYYAGVNYAYGLMMLSYNSKDIEEKIANYLWSKKVYKEIICLCESQYDANDYWINATLLEAYIAIGNHEKLKKHENICEKLVFYDNWKNKSTLSQINNLKIMLKDLEVYDKWLMTNH